MINNSRSEGEIHQLEQSEDAEMCYWHVESAQKRSLSELPYFSRLDHNTAGVDIL